MTAVAMALFAVVVVGIALQRVQMKQKRHRAGVDAAPVVAETGSPANTIYEGFQHVERVGGRRVFELRSERSLGSRSGWNEIENVVLQLYEDDGSLGPLLTCSRARYNTKTRETNLDGSVQVEFQDGSFLTTEVGHLREGGTEFETGAAVYFVGQDMAGSAGSATYNLNRDELILEDDLIVRSYGGDTVTAPTLAYDRTNRRAVFPDGVQVHFAQARVKAERGVIELSEADDQPQRVSFTGAVSMRVASAESPQVTSGRAEIVEAERDSAGRWQVKAGSPDDWVELIFQGEAQTLMSRMQAWTIRGLLDGAGLKAVRTEGRVCFEGIPSEGEIQYLEAKTARVWFMSGDATDLEFQGDVRMWTGESIAQAHRARLDASSGRAMLYGNPAGVRRVSITAPDGTMSSDQAVFFQGDDSIEVRGNVQGEMRQSGIDMPGSSADDDEPVRIASDSLSIEGGGELYVLEQGARVWQGAGVLQADEIRSWRDSRRLEARGHVRTTFPAQMVDPEASANADVVLTARAMDFDDGDQKAVYRGNVELVAPDYTLTAHQLDILFTEGRAIGQVIATGTVVMSDASTGYELRGTRAVRQVESGLVHLTGSPAVASDAAGNLLSGGSLTWDQASGRVTVSESTETIFQTEDSP